MTDSRDTLSITPVIENQPFPLKELGRLDTGWYLLDSAWEKPLLQRTRWIISIHGGSGFLGCDRTFVCEVVCEGFTTLRAFSAYPWAKTADMDTTAAEASLKPPKSFWEQRTSLSWECRSQQKEKMHICWNDLMGLKGIFLPSHGIRKQRIVDDKFLVKWQTDTLHFVAHPGDPFTYYRIKRLLFSLLLDHGDWHDGCEFFLTWVSLVASCMAWSSIHAWTCLGNSKGTKTPYPFIDVCHHSYVVASQCNHMIHQTFPGGVKSQTVCFYP